MPRTARDHQKDRISGAIRGDAIRGALSWPIAKRSVTVMLVIGTVLNLINQGDALLFSGPVNWWKVVLTYCVPFCVASYGAYCAFCTGKGRGKEID